MQNSSSASPVYVVSPGEPRFVTFYQALESASIKNENLGADNSSQLMGGLTKVDANATVPNGTGNDTANNDTASPTTIASIETTPSSESTVDITTTTQSADVTLPSGGTENTPESASTTAPTPANPDSSEVTTSSDVNSDQTTPVPTSEPIGITTPDNAITNISSTPEPLTTTESVEVDTSTSVSVTHAEMLPIMESTPSNTDVPMTMTTSTIPQTSSEASDSTTPSVTESVTPETTTLASLDVSENIEMNTIQQSEETTSRPTDVPIDDTSEDSMASIVQRPDMTTETNNAIDDVEMNTIQQSDAIMSTTIETNTMQQSDVTMSQTTEITSTERLTTEEISNDVIEILTTETPITTSTFRNRMIDFAQKILSHLQTIYPSTTIPTPEATSISTESSTPLRQVTTVSAEPAEGSTMSVETTSLLNTETTIGQNTDTGDTDSAQTTTDATNGPRETTEDTVGLDTTSSNNETGNESLESESTTPTQDTRSPENLPGDMTSAEVMSTPISRDFTTTSGPRSFNDTLLSELMTIAKSLFSEAMNDTRLVPSHITDVGTIQVNGIGDNKRDRLVSSNDTLATTPPPSQLTTADAVPELTTNPTQSSNDIEQQTIPSSNVESLDFTTNNPLATDPESTTSDMLNSGLIELTTNVATTEASDTQTNAVDTTNQAPEPTTIRPASDLQVTSDQSPVANVSFTTTTRVFDNSVTDTTDTSDTQAFSTEPSTEAARNLVNSTDTTTTNQSNDVTTNAPTQKLTDLVSESPNLITHFQDTTATTAQGTADSGTIQPEQTTETTIPTTPSAAPMSTNPTMLPESTDTTTIDTTNTSTTVEPTVTTTEPTITTTTLTSTTTIQTTHEPVSETTTSNMDMNEVSTETSSTTQGTTVPNEMDDLNMIPGMDDDREQDTTTSMTSTTTPTTTPTPTTMTMTTTMSTAPPVTSTPTTLTMFPNKQTVSFGQGVKQTSPTFASGGAFNKIPYQGRFGGSPMTPAPKFSYSSSPSSSSSKAPVRDYLIYGIYPNKTIVRKRPEDNLIDPRNVDSPYVIFGIYPDGRLVRKFPNGTIIPDSPRNPVEVVFTLSTTTTTNRPAPRPYYYNQANNQYQAPVYYNNRRPVDELTRIVQNRPSPVDIGLTANAIGVPFGGGPYFTGPLGTPASIPGANKMVSLFVHIFTVKLYFIPTAVQSFSVFVVIHANNR